MATIFITFVHQQHTIRHTLIIYYLTLYKLHLIYNKVHKVRWSGLFVSFFKFHYSEPRTLSATRPDSRTKSVHIEIERTCLRPEKVRRHGSWHRTEIGAICQFLHIFAQMWLPWQLPWLPWKFRWHIWNCRPRQPHHTRKNCVDILYRNEVMVIWMFGVSSPLRV